jgi:hypothetical protein
MGPREQLGDVQSVLPDKDTVKDCAYMKRKSVAQTLLLQ